MKLIGTSNSPESRSAKGTPKNRGRALARVDLGASTLKQFFNLIVWICGMVSSAQAAPVIYIQTSVNDVDGSPIGAVSSNQFLQSGPVNPTVTAPAFFGSYRFTHWTVSSYPATSYRDSWGRSLNPVSIVLLESTTATAHYLPNTRDIDGDGVPDGFEIEYFGDISHPANEDGDGDGISLLAEYAGGTNPLYGNSKQEGGVAWADSGLVTVNLAGYSSYTIRSIPAGTVNQSATVLPGTVVTTPNFTGTPSFGYWTLDGVRQQDAWGVALSQISFTMTSVNREAIAYLFSGDTDGDGVSDAFEQYYYGTLSNGSLSDTDGDGISLLAEYAGGTNPLYGNSKQEGGVAWADSASIIVNLTAFSRYTLISAPAGTVNQSALVLNGSNVTTPNMTQATFGYWELDGVRQQDPRGVALRQITFTVNGTSRAAVAHLFSSDSDGDGINDGFEQFYFGTLVNGAASDSDGDGVSTFLEYSFGMNPSIADASERGVQSNLLAVGQETFLSISFYRRVGDASLLFRVQESGDLGIWDDLSLSQLTIGAPLDMGDGTEFVRVRGTIPVTGVNSVPAGFLRVVVEKH